MKGTNLGEFQELILLTIGALHPEAYGISIKEEILKQTDRKVTLSTIHAALVRLEEKGYVKSKFGESTQMRGGKRKRFFTITAYGVKTLSEAKEQRESLWKSLPDIVFKLEFK
jgi:PadR family transcriptional regulator, regulatory protein PadR